MTSLAPMDQTREIIREVAERHGLTFAAMVGTRGPASRSIVRQAAYAEVHSRRPHLSLSQIGKAFGGRDHSTVLLGIEKHHARMAWADFLIDSAAGEYQPDMFARAA